jgi:phytoene desaturase
MNSPAAKRALVIGAGIAGLASAVRLAAHGWKVIVYESAAEPGGKLREAFQDGFRFDLGPSLFTMPELVVNLHDLAARSPVAEPSKMPPPFAFEKLDRSTHYFWEDGVQLTAWADRASFRDEVQSKLNIDGQLFEDHLHHSQQIFEATRGVFMEQSLHERPQIGRSGLKKAGRNLFRLPFFGSLHRLNRKTLREPHLVQLFDRYATYNGSNPYRAPAMMHIIPHLEHGIGTFFPKGGMAAIAQHVVNLCLALGVEFHFNQPVKRIAHIKGKVQGVLLETASGGERVLGDVVVSNADVYPTYRQLLPDLTPPEKTLSQERSTSGVVFYWGIRGTHAPLHLHNILFSKNYRREFDNIREKGHPGDDPTVYINITSKLQSSDAPAGCENWFVMINVGAKPDEIEALIPSLRETVVKKIERTLGVNIQSLIANETILTPREIEAQTSSWKGALYGASSNSPMAAFLRHRNRSTQLKGLYFCGGSVHPGGGIPLCLLSAHITTDLIERFS